MISFTPSTLKDFLRWLGINALIGIAIPFIYSTESFFSLEGLSRIWDDVLYSFLMSSAISSSIGINEKILNKHFPWLEHAGKRFFLEILGVTIFAFSAAFLLNVSFFAAFGRIDYDNFPWEYMFMNSLFPTGIGYLITAFFISRGFLSRAKAEAVKSEKLETEKYRSEVRLLRDQLNPHFLFNSLNVLTNLVYEDADKSADYIRNLSRFYRYVLEVQQEDTVELSRELKFTTDYLLLQQERFSTDALKFEVKLKNIDHVSLPPLALQLLVENALKHNRASIKEPLHIELTELDGFLEVRNNLQERSAEAEHLGIGLSNLIRRYELLGEKAPEVVKTELHFSVKIPLISEA